MEVYRQQGGLIVGFVDMRLYIDSVHFGKNELGNTFGQAFLDYDKTIAQPFQQFLRGVYSKLHSSVHLLA